MTSTGEFTPDDGQDFDLEQQPEYPSAFGVTFTPTVTGIGLLAVGIAFAAYLFLTLVGPKQEQKQALESQRDDLQSQIAAQPDLRAELADIQQRQQIATAQQQQVFSLLSSGDTLDTLPTDLERATSAIAASLSTAENPFSLKKIDPQAPAAQPVTDGTFGARVDGLVERQTFDIEIQGTFGQIRGFIASIERLQPLLIVRDLEMSPTEAIPIRYSPETGQFSPLGSAQLSATFFLEAILPADNPQVAQSSEEEEE